MKDFVFKVGKNYSKIKLLDIVYIQAEKRYVTIVTQNDCYSSMISITELEKLLPADLFCRIHRSYIISLSHTDKFNDELAFVGNRKIPIAKQYKNALKNAFTVIHGNACPFSLVKIRAGDHKPLSHADSDQNLKLIS